MSEICPHCEDEFKCVGSHWAKSPQCDYPSLTQKQQEVTIGLLMGDGTLSEKAGNNPRLQLEMTNPEYLEYIDEIFGIFGTGVSFKMTAQESAKQARNRGFRPNAKAENYSDIYEWHSRTHPEFQKFTDWYSSGEKVWPEDIELTPTVLKHWYCGDGYWNNSVRHNYIGIAMANEIEETKKISKLFKNSGLPSPSNYAVSEREDGSKTCNAEFTVKQSKELWEYMGEPLPGFEYKWSDKYE